MALSPETATGWLARDPAHRTGDEGPLWHGRIVLAGIRCATRVSHLPGSRLGLEIELLVPPRKGLTRTFGAILGRASGMQWSAPVDATGRTWTAAVDYVVDDRIPDLPTDKEGRNRFGLLRLTMRSDGTEAEWAPDAAPVPAEESQADFLSVLREG